MGEVSYRPLIESMTWSHSRLKCFDECPYRFFTRYIRGEEESPLFYASYGSFVHRLIERYYNGELTASELPLAFLRGFSAEVEGERPAAKTVLKYIADGKAYFDGFRPLPFEPVAVEHELHFDVDGIPFTGFVDFLGKRDGALAIVDHKSHEMKPRSKRAKPTAKDRELDEMLEQLYLYAHGVSQVFGEHPKWLCFNSFRNGQFIEEPFDGRVCERVLDDAKRRIEDIADEEEFRPDVDWFRCKNLCGFHEDCCYFQGR